MPPLPPLPPPARHSNLESTPHLQSADPVLVLSSVCGSYLYVGYYRPDESKRHDLDATFWGELQGPAARVVGGLGLPLVEA